MTSDATPLATRSAAFLAYLDGYVQDLQPTTLDGLIASAGGPEGVAMVVVDLVGGFCTEGALATPRLGNLIGPVGDLYDAGWEAGVRRFAVMRDAHAANAPEFAAFGPHCVVGSGEDKLEPDLGTRTASIKALNAANTYHWKATWGSNTGSSGFRVQVYDGGVGGVGGGGSGVGGTQIYDYGKT